MSEVAATSGDQGNVDLGNDKKNGAQGGAQQVSSKMADAVARAPGSPGNSGGAKSEDDKKEPVKRILRWTDGEIEGGYDVDDPEQFKKAQRDLQLSKASYRRFDEAKALNDEAEKKLSALKSKDPRALMALLQEHGINFDQLATDRIYEQMQLESMTPDQKARFEAEKKLAEVTADQEKQASQAQEAEIKQYQDGYRQWLDQNLGKAFDGIGMPKSPYLMGLAAFKIRSAARAGVDLSIYDAAEYAKEEAADHVKQLIGSLSEEKVLAILGEEFGIKISRHLAGKIRGSQGQRTPFHTSQPGVQTQQESKKMTPEEWREHIRSRAT